MSDLDDFRPDDAGDESATYRPESASRTGLVVTVMVVAALLVVAAVIFGVMLL